jgi:uncharacterized protein with GYD domain
MRVLLIIGVLSTLALGSARAETDHFYLAKVEFTSAAIKKMQTQPPTALRATVGKFVEAAGGKLVSWYLDYANITAYVIVSASDVNTIAATQLSTNASGFTHVTVVPIMTAEEADQAVAKAKTIQSPHQEK